MIKQIFKSSFQQQNKYRYTKFQVYLSAINKVHHFLVLIAFNVVLVHGQLT